jgi:hypothetical protein
MPASPLDSSAISSNEVFIESESASFQDSDQSVHDMEPQSPGRLLASRIQRILEAAPTTGLVPPPTSARSVLSSEEIIPASLPRRVNTQRGKKEMGGPALSLFKLEHGHVSAWKPPLFVEEFAEEEVGLKRKRFFPFSRKAKMM